MKLTPPRAILHVPPTFIGKGLNNDNDNDLGTYKCKLKFDSHLYDSKLSVPYYMKKLESNGFERLEPKT